MNDEVKEILIDLIDYYNTVGTESDPGINTFETVAKRASKALERHARDSFESSRNNSSDVDPFAMDVVGYSGQEYGGFPEPHIVAPEDDIEPIVKSEDEW